MTAIERKERKTKYNDLGESQAKPSWGCKLLASTSTKKMSDDVSNRDVDILLESKIRDSGPLFGSGS